MAIAINPADYLARLDTSDTTTGTEAGNPPATNPAGTVAYFIPSDGKEQFYLILFLALLLVLVFLYLMEKDKMMNRQMGG